MERYLRMITINTRYHLLPHILASLLMIALTPIMMGTEHLKQEQVAKIIECYTSLMGILLLIPIFIPEMDRDIYDLIRSKKESITRLHLIRTLESIFIIVLTTMLLFVVLSREDCVFSWSAMIYTLMANAVFLGGMGIFAYSLSSQIVFAYMMPLIYYVSNYGMGEEKLGMLYLFSMQSNHFVNKHYLIGVGLLFMTSGIVLEKYKWVRKKG